MSINFSPLVLVNPVLLGGEKVIERETGVGNRERERERERERRLWETLACATKRSKREFRQTISKN